MYLEVQMRQEWYVEVFRGYKATRKLQLIELDIKLDTANKERF